MNNYVVDGWRLLADGSWGKLVACRNRLTVNSQRLTTNSNQSGIATILAIGLSALLLCLGIAFVTTSMIEKKASQNDQHMVAARADAQTAFNKAIASLKISSYDPNENYDAIVSHRPELNVTNKWTDADTETLIEKLKTVVNGHTYYELPDKCYEDFAATDSGIPSWIYLKPDGDKGAIVGRMAYVIVSDKGKIDAWSVIDSGVNANASAKKPTPPSEVDYGGGITSIAPDGSSVWGRPGRDLTEISLASLEADTEFLREYTQNMSAISCRPGGIVDIGNAGRWKSYEDMFSKLGITDHGTQYYFKSVFYENNPPDAEAFWVDNSDSLIDTNELYHRFNVARTTWPTVNEFVTSIGTPFKSSLAWSDNETNYLPWLKNWKDKGGFECADSARNQIIANLIDYCDPDTNATTDMDAKHPIPAYVGLERCPYINEIRIKIQCLIGYGNDKTHNFSLGEKPDIELINMYGESMPLYAYYTMKMDYTWGNSSITSSGTRNINSYEFPEITSTPKSYCIAHSANFIDGTNGNYKTTTVPQYDLSTFAMTFTISNLRVKAVGSNKTDLYDYSILPDTTFTVTFSDFSKDDTQTLRSRWVTLDYQVADPRQNLNAVDWDVSLVCDTNESVDTGTIGSKNLNFIPNGTDKDPEPNADEPWKISTAYIRNGPMRSPWELGFIHRAKAFQTLNLKKYNENQNNGYGFRVNSGGQDYASGDANILDQIKMSSDKETYGKININSSNKSVLRALFDHIAVGCLPENPGAGGTIISRDKATEIADEVDTENGGLTFPGVLTRAQIVNRVPEFSGKFVEDVTEKSSNQTTDREQEEIIGKFINLTKAESSEDYVVIAVGEAIRDVGGTSFDKYGKPLTSPSVKGTYEPDVDEVLATQKIFALVKHDYKKGTFYIQRMFYLTD